MTALKLNHNVFTLDNRQLLSAGTIVSNEVIEELISTHKNSSTKSSPFLKHGSIKDNLLLFFSQPPYNTIFADEKRTASLLDLIGQALVAVNRKDRPYYSECTVSLDKRGTPPRDNVYGIIVDES